MTRRCQFYGTGFSFLRCPRGLTCTFAHRHQEVYMDRMEMIQCRKRGYNFRDHKNLESVDDMRQYRTPFVTLKNMRHLSSFPYMVSLKADGERMLLLCEAITGDIYLISKSSPLRHIKGTKGLKFQGFILDTEVITLLSGLEVVLAFNVMCVDQVSSSIFQACEELGINMRMDYFTNRCVPVSFSDSLKLLDILVPACNMARLMKKESVPAVFAQRVWEESQNLPYPTNGLIFTRLTPPEPIQNFSDPVLKWSPPELLTIDVAVGGAIECNARGAWFRVYLLGHIPNPPPKYKLKYDVAENIVPPGPRTARVWDRAGFVKYQNELKFVRFSCGVKDLTDLQIIEIKRHEERQTWCKQEICTLAKCPCQQVSFNNKKICHCIHCGVLGLSDMDKVHTCIQCNIKKVEQCVHCGAFAISDIDQMHKCMQCPCGMKLWIPGDDSMWAAHHIVEVIFNTETDKLDFRRLRRDKSWADTIGKANTIIGLQKDPMKLSQIKYNSDEIVTSAGLPSLLGNILVASRMELTNDESKRLSLCTAGVLKRKSYLFQTKNKLFSGIPNCVEVEIMLHMNMKELVVIRCVSKSWRKRIDTTNIRNFSKWLGNIKTTMDVSEADSLPPCSVALFLRMGGSIERKKTKRKRH